MKKRVLKLLLLSVTMLGLLVGCSSKEDANKTSNAEAEKVIKVGTEATVPGWIQSDNDGKLTGYDYDVWTEIGKRTGYKIEFKVMEWNGMWAMLEDGRLDSLSEQISISPEREEKYNFSEPYAYNVYCLLAAKDNKELNSMDDLKSGMTISCETNTSDESIVDAIDEQYGIELKRTYYDGMSVQDVALGRCDLWPRAETSCKLTVKEVDNLKILGKTNVLETNAYPFTKTERGEELSKVVSKAIKDMREDGTLKELSEKWFSMDISEKPSN